LDHGYTYYNTPYTGNYVAEIDFRVNPITNKYCLVTAVDGSVYQGAESGIIYYEMDPITTGWTKTRVSQSYRQSREIYLDFKSDGNPILAYPTRYITNKGGIIQKYNLGNQSNSARIPHLSFKRYKNEIKPFIFYYPNVGSYRYFQYLEDEAFVTGEFKNQLPSFNDGKQMIIV
jgi:hypothetical protein